VSAPAAAPPEPAGGRRARTKAQNRAALLRAARDAFAELGFGAASVRDIVRRTDLASGTFYNYFPDKEAVFRALVEEFAGGLRARLTAARAAATTPEAFVGDAYRAFFAYVAQERAMFELLRRNAGSIPAVLADPALAPGVGDLAGDLRAAIRRGDLPGHDVELMSAAMAGAGLEVAARMLERDPVDPEAAARFATELFLGGIERVGRG